MIVFSFIKGLLAEANKLPCASKLAEANKLPCASAPVVTDHMRDLHSLQK